MKWVVGAPGNVFAMPIGQLRHAPTGRGQDLPHFRRGDRSGQGDALRPRLEFDEAGRHWRCRTDMRFFGWHGEPPTIGGS
jgi:hypothetical protein